MADIIWIFTRIIFWTMATFFTVCRIAIPILIIVLLVKLIKRYSQK